METGNNLYSPGFCKNLLNKIFLSHQGMNYALKGIIFTMHPGKTLILVLTCAIVFSCKKENNNSTNASADQPDCVDQHELKTANIIDGEYIVAYKASSLDAHTSTLQRLSEISRNILERNKIISSAIETTFQGEPGGFVVHLSLGEVARRRKT